jgi:hypothetical protein
MIRTLTVHGLVDETETTAVLDAVEAGDVFLIDVFLITRDGFLITRDGWPAGKPSADTKRRTAEVRRA